MPDKAGQLQGKVAVVTGALGDIGSAIILRLLEEGAQVIGVDMEISNASEKAPWRLDLEAGNLIFFKGNVTSEEDVIAYNDEAVKQFGRLDIAVLSAGILPKPTPWVDTDVSLFDRTLSINTKGVFLGAKHAALTMKSFANERKAEGGCSIIIISSVAGFKARAKTSSYAASKFGVRGLCLTLAQELAPLHIRVNAVFPGVTDSAMFRALPDDYRTKTLDGIPMMRPGQPQEQADLVVFFASDGASFVTGANWPAHGGLCPA